MLTVSSSPSYCWKNVEGEKIQSCTCGPANKWTVTSTVLNAGQWESVHCLDLKGVSHTRVNGGLCLPHKLWRLLRKSSQELFLALVSLFLGGDNAFLPLSVGNQIRLLRRRQTGSQCAHCVAPSLQGL